MTNLFTRMSKPAKYGSKRDLIDRTARQCKVTPDLAELVIDQFLATMVEALTEGTEVKLPGFGNFTHSFRRPQRVVLDGKEMLTRAKLTVRFSPSNKLKWYKEGESEA